MVVLGDAGSLYSGEHIRGNFVKVKPVWNDHPRCQEKWSFQKGGRSRQVQFARNPKVNGIFHKLENCLSRAAGLWDRSRQVLLCLNSPYVH